MFFLAPFAIPAAIATGKVIVIGLGLAATAAGVGYAVGQSTCAASEREKTKRESKAAERDIRCAQERTILETNNLKEMNAQELRKQSIEALKELAKKAWGQGNNRLYDAIIEELKKKAGK